MTEETAFKQILDNLPLGAWRYHPKVGSTNDLALAWAGEGAPDVSLVLADEQTAGRGRAARKWITPPGSALAMSLVLRPTDEEAAHLPRFTALGALGLIRALAHWDLQAELKWPNDVLLDGKKTAGVLVEADWQGERLEALVLGMGVNVLPGSVPEAGQVRYPATCVADALGGAVDRWLLLGQVLKEILALRAVLPEQRFLAEWHAALAFTGQWIWFRQPGGEPRQVRVAGLDSEGAIVLESEDGGKVSAVAGEILMAYN